MARMAFPLAPVWYRPSRRFAADVVVVAEQRRSELRNGALDPHEGLCRRDVWQDPEIANVFPLDARILKSARHDRWNSDAFIAIEYALVVRHPAVDHG